MRLASSCCSVTPLRIFSASGESPVATLPRAPSNESDRSANTYIHTEAPAATGLGLIACTIVTLAPLSRRKEAETAVQNASAGETVGADLSRFDPLDAASEDEPDPTDEEAEAALERLHEREALP